MLTTNIDPDNLIASPESVAAGLMAPGDEVLITPAGMLAMAGRIAFDPDPDTEGRDHCIQGLYRVITTAEAYGLSKEIGDFLFECFARHINPTEHPQMAEALRVTAKLVRPDSVLRLLGGEATH